MQDAQVETQQGGESLDIAALRERAIGAAQSIWRPAATSVAVALILLFGWGVVNGKHGLSAWRQQQVQDRQLRQQIQDLQQENGRLREHVERLKSDPNAIEHEAREQLHYAKPGEIIYRLPEDGKHSDPSVENEK
jgi:cell division protein FtsB